MQETRRLFCILCMVLILTFAIVHLGVGIGIIVRFRHYDDIFHPERGLAGYNIFISLYALIVCGFGLYSILTNQHTLSKVAALTTVVLVVFVFASLITALVIHCLAITYVSSRFTDHMNNYQTDQNSRVLVNMIQINFDCCGTNTWLDWSSVQLNETKIDTNTTTMPNATENDVVANKAAIASTTNASTSMAGTTNVGIYGLPLSFGVTLPESCCTTDQSLIDNLDNLYCISNASNVQDSIHTNGCWNEIAKLSVGQTIGLAVINSFLIVIALVSIAALYEINLYGTSSRIEPTNQPASEYDQVDSNEVFYPPSVSYYNYNA